MNRKGMRQISYISAALFSLGLLASCGTIDGKPADEAAKETAGKIADKTEDFFGDVGEATGDAMESTFGKDIVDPTTGLDRDDYRQLMRPKTPTLTKKKGGGEPAIPDVSQLMIEPGLPIVGKDKLVTLNVTEDIPLKEVLIELARRADVDVEIDPGINGGIIFRAKDRPFQEVMERIANLTGLRYSVINGVLKVERDFPYVENYQVPFLNQVRTAQGSTNIRTDVLSASGGSGGGGAGGGGGGGGGGGKGLGSGSNSTISSNTEDADIWASVENNVKRILEKYGRQSPGVAANSGGTTSDDDGLGEVLGTQGAPGQPPVNPTPPPRIANAGGAVNLIPEGSEVLSTNRQAGVISVMANSRQHKEVKSYLEQVQQQYSAQVLIEAKVVEVRLDDRFSAGIDWSLFINEVSNLPDVQINSNFRDNLPFGRDAISQNLTATFPNQELFGIDGLDISSAISLLQDFGVTRTLSSPRINAANNQQAVLTFAQNFLYFKTQIEEEQQENNSGSNRERLTITTQPNTVPIGVILTLQPSIDLTKNEVTMNIRPTISRLVNIKLDPAIEIIRARNNLPASIQSQYPEVEVRELDSVLRVKSGQVMVIGGLISERSTSSETGIPGLADVPYAGNLFKQTQRNTDSQDGIFETVIFIKATIVPPYGVSTRDKQFYRKFTTDAQPLAF